MIERGSHWSGIAIRFVGIETASWWIERSRLDAEIGNAFPG